MKRFVVVAGVVCCVFQSFATDARVIVMGRGNDAFFMDDFSIFRNPANIGIFPNMIGASLGYYAQDKRYDDTTSFSALNRANRDPLDPLAGGILSFSLNEGSEGGSQYPMFSMGAFLNRRDKLLDYVTPGKPEFGEAFFGDRFLGRSDTLPEPVGKFDMMLGYALKGGGMIGAGTYLAFQSDGDDTATSVLKGSVGVNWPVATSTDLEASISVAGITAKRGTAESVIYADFAENNDVIVEFDARLFAALTVLNGDFVPHLGVDYVMMSNYTMFRLEFPGLGVNINIDKGFCFGGLEFILEQKDHSLSARASSSQSTTGFGGRISFGLERSIWWDWFVLRGGLSKRILYVTDSKSSGTGRWEQNAEAAGTDDDFIGLGFGLNIENRLKVDAVLGDDVLYTWTNLISGPQHHFLSKFTFTFSF